MKNSVTGIVLAGGKSIRLGRDKALETVGKRTLLQRVVDALAQVSDDIVVVTSPGQTEERVPPSPLVRVVRDIHPERGPAAGLYAGLRAARSVYSWAVGCDLPFLNPMLLSYLMTLAPGYDAVIPTIEVPLKESRDSKRPDQTLHAVYNKSCIPILEELLGGQSSIAIHDLLPRINVCYVKEAEVEELDPELRSFFNINTEADLARARAMD